MDRTDPVVIVISEEEEPRAPRYLFRPAARWPARTAGISVTVLIHLLISAPLLLGFAAHKKPSQPQDGPGSVECSSRGERYESMILLDLSALDQSSAEELDPPQFDTEGLQL